MVALMNWFQKIFKSAHSAKPTIANKYTTAYFEGLEDFKIGKQLYKEFALSHSLHKERRQQKTIAALEFFDKAIEKGYDDAEAFLLRAMCLRNLDYDIEAVEDLNKCIEKDP